MNWRASFIAGISRASSAVRVCRRLRAANCRSFRAFGLTIGLAGLMSILLALGCPNTVAATLQGSSGVLQLVKDKESYPLGHHLEIIEDPTRRMPIEEAVAPERSRYF